MCKSFIETQVILKKKLKVNFCRSVAHGQNYFAFELL